MTPREAHSRKRLQWFACTGPFILGAAACLAPAASAQNTQQVSPVANPATPAPADTKGSPASKGSPAIVIGFLGGYVPANSPTRSEVKMAEQLRASYPDTVHVKTFANRNMNSAYREILELLAGAPPATVSGEEKQRARIIIYGHSWGGTAAVALARKLQKDGIPVLLTVQVDSVEHLHVDDSVIPANVAKAANFYQRGGMLHGREKITAADPAHTQILGNYLYDYAKNPVECHGYPFWDRWFSKTHMEIECDPKVWNEVESLIRRELPPAAAPRQSTNLEKGQIPQPQ